MMFDPKEFVRNEKAVINELCTRLGVESLQVRQELAKLTEIAAMIAADRLEGKSTAHAERGLEAAIQNIRARVTISAYEHLAGYIEGALIRSAGIVGSILIGAV